MKLVIFGLTVTSSWGNGHATLWRALLNSFAGLGHEAVFFERDVAYYAEHRDLHDSPHYRIELYRDWEDVRSRAEAELRDADAAMVTSYCPCSAEATDLVLSSGVGKTIFYDLDTPVTLQRLEESGAVDYIPPCGLAPFDLVLSYTGGQALEKLKEVLGAVTVAPLYGSVDPTIHKPSPPVQHFKADLSYLGTYAADRQSALDALFLTPARELADKRFLIGGAQYPQDFPWSPNVYFVRHVPPADHAAFYGSSSLTLNITRAAMAQMGYCPSGRLFEAAACGAAIVSDWWEGLEEFFEPDREILIASSSRDVVQALSRTAADLARIGAAARARTLEEHTARERARELVDLISAEPSRPARDGALTGSI